MNDKANIYDILMNSKNFSIFLYRYIYNETSITILKNIISKELNVNIDKVTVSMDNGLSICVQLENKQYPEYKILQNILLQFLKNEQVQQDIIQKIDTINRIEDSRINTCNLLEVYSNIENPIILNTLFNAYGSGKFLSINL